MIGKSKSRDQPPNLILIYSKRENEHYESFSKIRSYTALCNDVKYSFVQDSYRSIKVKFKDVSRTFKVIYQKNQELKRVAK